MKIIEVSKRIIKKVKAKSNSGNRGEGQILTLISGICLYLANSGELKHPTAKVVVMAISTVTGIMAGKKALKTK